MFCYYVLFRQTFNILRCDFSFSLSRSRPAIMWGSLTRHCQIPGLARGVSPEPTVLTSTRIVKKSLSFTEPKCCSRLGGICWRWLVHRNVLNKIFTKLLELSSIANVLSMFFMLGFPLLAGPKQFEYFSILNLPGRRFHIFHLSWYKNI